MIKSFMAYTHEVDDPKLAVSEILEQLDIQKNLLKNSVGIVFCYSDFIDSGVLDELSNALPFPFIGSTTLNTMVNGEIGEYMLGITVLTSDDVCFEAAISESLDKELDTTIEAAYESIAAKHNSKPSFVFAVAPLIYTYAGDQYVEVLNKLCGGAPIFGTLSVDHTIEYSKTRVIKNHVCKKDALAMILMYGEVNADFYMVGLSPNKIQKQMAVITKSNASLLIEVNNMPVSKYLETLGLAEDGAISSAVNTVPLIIDYNDGTVPITRAMFAVTPEGYAVCGGLMPVGATLSIAVNTKRDVMKSTEEVVQKMDKSKDKTAIIFSCVGRNFALGADNLLELESVKTHMGNDINHIMCYSAGEICPVYLNGEIINRFHNITFTAVTFN